MSKKKHIDELFKEQLQNFEAAPSPEVWNSIQARMKKEKEDRKVIPLWWKLGGVAALLALLLALNFVFQPFAGDPDTVIVTEDNDKSKDLKDDSDVILKDVDLEEGIISEEDKKENSTNEADELSNKKTTPQKTSTDKILNQTQKDRNAVAVETDKQKEALPVQGNDRFKKNDLGNDPIKKDAVGVVTSEKEDPVNKQIKDPDPLIKKDISEEVKKDVTGIAKTSDKKEEGVNKADPNNDPLIKKDVQANEEGVNKTEEAVAIEQNKKEEETKIEENKKSIFDAIEENKEEAVTKTSDRDIKSWEVTPNFGPVYYNSISGGSAIDPSFADNAQNGDVNFSYGVQVSYALNDRLSLRSGVSNVDLGYTTGGVELATGPVDIALSTVDYGGRGVVLSAYDRGTLNNLPPPSGENDPFARLNPKSTSGNAEVIQNLSYYEVPMELKYALLTRRFGVNMIGGFSTLFLGNNEISVRDGNFREVLGEANNLNSVSFSTNVGLGFDYKISKRLKFNVEPMFKYQLNPYSDSSVDFKPYYFGIYSGLSFKF